MKYSIVCPKCKSKWKGNKDTKQCCLCGNDLVVVTPCPETDDEIFEIIRKVDPTVDEELKKLGR
jgi:hypothetical protein